MGEIRDSETARSRSSLAQQGPPRALDAPHERRALHGGAPGEHGLDPYLVATTVNLIVAQRLVRRICSKCKVDATAEVPAKTLIDIGFTPDEIGTFQVMKGKGCQTCNGTGYKGRVGLYEVMEITEGIRDLIMVGATAVEIKRKALEEGMLTLRMSGLEKIKGGVTTVEEVLRETVLGRCPDSDDAPEGSSAENGVEAGLRAKPAPDHPGDGRETATQRVPMNESRTREPHLLETLNSKYTVCLVLTPRTSSETSSRGPSPSSSRARTGSSTACDSASSS